MRIFVAGSTGSGKTTLAGKLARAMNLPVQSLDDIHWVRDASGDRRRDPAERLRMLERVVQNTAWIIEGVQFKWADIALERADHIIVVDIPRLQNTWRILKRFVSRRVAPLDQRRGLSALREELGWSADYYHHERAMLFEKLAQWPGKIHVVRDLKSQLVVERAVRSKPSAA